MRPTDLSKRRSLLALALVLLAAAGASGQQSAALFDAPLIVAGPQRQFALVLDLDGDTYEDSISSWISHHPTIYGVFVLNLTGHRNDGAGALAESWVLAVPGVLHPPNGTVHRIRAAAADMDGDPNGDFVLAVNEVVGGWA